MWRKSWLPGVPRCRLRVPRTTGHATFSISPPRRRTISARLHQRSSGVAEYSQHVLDKAIEVRLSGSSIRSMSEYARSLSRGGVRFYARSDFVHVDTGRIAPRRRPRDAWPALAVKAAPQ